MTDVLDGLELAAAAVHAGPKPDPQSEEEKKRAERRKSLGASDIPAAAGLSPWVSPMGLWLEKTGRTDGQERTEAMEFGLRAEPMLLAWFKDRTGMDVISVQGKFRHPDHEWATSTVDGLAVPAHIVRPKPADSDDVVESKTTSEMFWEDEEVPDHYQAQAQWQMACTGKHRVFFPTLHMRRFALYEVHRDDELIADLLDIGAWFWNLVLTDTPPPADAHSGTASALIEAFPGGTGEVIELDHLAEDLERLRLLKMVAKQHDDEETLLENRIKAALGNAEVGTIEGVDAVTWRARTYDRVDVKALREDMPEIASKFAVTADTRTFLVKKPKKESS